MFHKKSTKDLVQPAADSTDTAVRTMPDDTDATPKRKGFIKHKKLEGSHPQKDKNQKEHIPIQDIIKSKRFIGIAAIVAAALLAFVIGPLMKNAAAKTIAVVVAVQDIPTGAQITADMLSVQEMGAVNLPDGTILDGNDIIGKFTSIAAIAGDILTTGRISDHYPSDDPGLTALPTGKMAMSATLADLAQSVSGKLRTGDVIQLFAVYENNTDLAQGNHSIPVPELQRVEVLAVTNSNAQDIVTGAGAVADSDKQISTVTLAVNQRQAAVLAGLDHVATLHAALVTRGDAERSAAALNEQEDYFVQLDAQTEATPPTQSTATPAPTDTPTDPAQEVVE